MGTVLMDRRCFLLARIHPLQFQFAVGQRHLVVKAVALLLVIGDVHGDRTPAEEHPDVAVLWKQGREG